MSTAKKSHKVLKIVGGVLGAIILLLACVIA